jgi:hypothetical protein
VQSLPGLKGSLIARLEHDPELVDNLEGKGYETKVLDIQSPKPPSNLAFLPDFCSLFGHPT